MKCDHSLASKANRIATLKRLAEGSRDAHGGFSAASYTTVRNLWCIVKPVRGGERLSDAKLTEVVDTLFITDYVNVKDLLESADRNEYKLTYNNVDYDITHIIDIEEAHKDVEIYAKRGEAA